jgi:phosphoenolpyruvate-protein phosphotransferase/dihydroxyacetone kinase phosphotransfer subunit
MVGIVVVSHSDGLARGVVALAREMAPPGLLIEAAGGVEDAPQALGTDAERIRRAIETVGSEAGVLVLMDLGSALMSAEFAAELVESTRVLLSDAPLVEGAVAAAAAAGGGASLEEVAAEARGALGMKRAQLGIPTAADEAGSAPAGGTSDPDASVELAVTNEIGLHARPAARVVALVRGLDVDVRLSRGGRTVSAASLTGVVSLGARRGDTVTVTATGPDAPRAVEALVALAVANFGDPAGPADPADPAGAPAPEERGISRAHRCRLMPRNGEPEPALGPAPGETLSGIAVGDGIAVGPAHRLGRPAPFTPPPGGARVAGDPPDGDGERGALDGAIAAARAAIEADRDRVGSRASADAAGIFDAHLALLDDAALLDPAQDAIAAGTTADRAWSGAVGAVAAIYRGLEDPRLRERAVDVEDVGRRVLDALTGAPATPVSPEGIVIADELTPAEAAGLDPERVRGIATARGSATAHAAILARALGLPAAVGLGPALLAVTDGTEVLLDGGAGTLTVTPDPAAAAEARERGAALARRRADARDRALEPALTRDGTRIEVLANLGDPGEARIAVALGAEGVGLLRTEFLYLERTELPGEAEQVATLREIARALERRPLVVRTLDAGADKPLPALRTGPEANPFLGVRGVRLSLAEPELLLTQLRAVLRVAAEFPQQLRVMVPMVSVLDEVLAVRQLLERARGELGSTVELPLGIMVEVPAAALDAGALAAHVDFFSIGTNDLTQYTMAAERGNARVAGLLDGLRAPVRELVRMTVAAAGGRPVAVCGELAGDPEASAELVRAGVRELSMAPALIPEAKAALRQLELR